MSEIVSTIAYRRLRAPREDGAVLFDPPLADETVLLQQNVALREATDCDIQGQSLSQLRAQARLELLHLARQYTGTYRDVAFDQLDPQAPLILVGHQPELIHPGVWFKNFLLAHLAQRTGSHAVNLLIDNDSVRHNSLRVPGGSVQDPTVQAVPLDLAGPPVPYEARGILDAELFASFGQRAAKVIAPLVPRPLLEQFWPHVVEAAQRERNLGRAIAQGRHRLEGQWGLNTLELPLSVICDTRSFRAFAAHLLGQAGRLCTVHNACVAQYRQANKVRSHTHPVPDLTRKGEWVEVPFWLWTDQQTQRRAAFVARRGRQVLLSDRAGIEISLEVQPGGDAGRCVEQLEAACQKGVRLRPRALITTMFARLVLSDIFIHGIGGAKYDQVTDAIVRRFLAVEPPEFLVATATLKLPLARASVEPQDLQRIRRLLRDLQYHPELHVDEDPETLPLVAEKKRWATTAVPPERWPQRHAVIQRVNRALQAKLTARRQQLRRELADLRTLMRKQAILDSREYAFCLFPEERLRKRLLDLSRP